MSIFINISQIIKLNLKIHAPWLHLVSLFIKDKKQNKTKTKMGEMLTEGVGEIFQGVKGLLPKTKT